MSTENGEPMSEGRPSVRVEIVDAGLTGAADQPVGPGTMWRRIAAAIGGLLVVTTLIGLASSGDSEPLPAAPSAPPTSQPADAPPGGVPAQRTLVDLDPSSITFLAPLEDQWIAVTRNDRTLLWSGDGGLTWATSAVADQPQNVLAVGTSGSGQPSALVAQPVNDGVRVDTQVWRDGAWILDPQRTPLIVESGRIVSTMLARESIVVVEDVWGRPVPEVSSVLAEFVAQSVADRVCSVVRTIVDGASVYNLFDCMGELIGSIGSDLIDIGSEADDRLAFAQDVLRSRNTVLIAPPGRPVDRIELGPAQRVLSIAPTRDGFVALMLDSVDVLDNTNLLYSQALSARLVHWERSTDTINRLDMPVTASAWAGNSVVSNGGNSVTLVTTLGLFRAESPFDDWRLATVGPKERLAPGQRFGSPLFGEGFYVDDRENPGVFWATCCDGEMMPDGSWETIETNGTRFDRVLIATDSWVTFASPDRTIVEVPR